MPVLRVFQEKGEASDFSLRKTEILLGRQKGNDIVLEGQDISRKHARITQNGVDFILADLDSHNGTLVNGQAIQSIKLKDGDEIRIGKCRLIFVAEAEPLTEEAVPLPAPATKLTREVLEQTITSRGGLLAFLRKIPLFSVSTDEELAELAEVAEPVTAAAGQRLFDQGEAGEKFYLVFSGKVRIVRKAVDQKEINLGLRTKGDHFGETAVITGKPHLESARAVDDSILIALGEERFNRFLLGKPKLREYFDKFIKYSSVYRFIKTSTDLAAVPPPELQDLAKRLKAEFFNAGDAVFRQGTEPERLYLVETGKLKAVKWIEGKPKTVNLFREGDFFGDRDMIEGTPHFADIICLTPCQLLSLDREDFQEIIQSSPKIKKALEERIQSHRQETYSVPFTEIIKQELSALKPITVQAKAPGEAAAAPKPMKRRRRRLSALFRKRLRFPFIEQYDQMTCGTTCIMMIAKSYGKQFSSARLRELAHVDMSGASLAGLASAAEQLGFSTRGMKLDYETLKSVALPCIVHWRGYHFVVVYKIDDKHVWVCDPALGHRKYRKENFLEGWKGVTLTLEPGVEFEKQEEDASSFRNFLQFVVPYKTILFEIAAASLLVNLFGLATPIFTQNIVDKVLVHQNMSMLNLMLIGMLIVLVFRILTMIVRQYLIVHVGMKIDLRMLVQFYKHLLALPLSYFKVRKVGDFISRFNENVTIRNFFTETALSIILDAFLIVVYFLLMFYYNVKLTLLVLVFIPAFILLTVVFTPIFRRLNIDSFAARSESESHLIESLQGIETVKATNIEYPTRWKWENKFIKNLNVDFRLLKAELSFYSIGDFAGTLCSTLVLWLGAQTVMKGGLSIGELMAFMALLGSVMTPLNRIMNVWDQIQETLVSVDRLNDVFAAKAEFPEAKDEARGMILRKPRGEISFENVYFRFGGEDDPYILSDISLKIAPGQRVAIVGRSGSGKTTLAKLIARFYDVTEGKVLVDGQDVKNLNLSNLRRLVGFVLQENFLFNGTIRENISLGDPEESLEKVIEAAKLANAHEFISNLGMGYDTRVGESGLQLSGGQKQRVAIARVLYAKPRIIIFDEATSSLDTESEQAIQKNLEEILKDKTAIIIAHRLSTVRNAGRIIVLDNGEIVEQGTHEELMEQKGLYHYLNYQQLNL
jgi:subfamily B ATP-binding cassette protein HlyB/CyaB